MVKGLIIETSSEKALVAIAKQKDLIAYTTIAPAHNLSKELLPTLTQLLSQNNIELKELNYIACGIGPGAYTGVRVGATVAKSLSYSLNIPLYGFESPLAFLPDKSGTFAFLADAKMGQFYLLIGSKIDQSVKLNLPGQLVDKEKLDMSSIKTDFLAYPTQLNPALIASLAFERFSTCENQELKLLYYR